ncbi:GNAT family N-acetyltransferase [Palleronia caenipelagi]|uniref:GNAT family N-acetyltransferase n=1 Tax=Palleronia caenipelagi TaxID=2489174 RepID=A0A547Q5R3_9RHOB|nr:GNAT family N-acetyltransferase [Palleronia caenipelagi]TRD21720.1 GNAT family N-acetyltransferase [Palleronia caenipelagi]
MKPRWFDDRLADGTPVRVRSLSKDDGDWLRRGLECLSDESRIMRFFHPVKALSDAEVEALTDAKRPEHRALGVWRIENGREVELIATGRYVRSETNRRRAEVALTVLDPYHRKGLGAHLLGALLMIAAENNITLFDALVDGTNAPVLGLFRALGGELERDGSEVTVRLAVLKTPEGYPENGPGLAVRRASQIREKLLAAA